MKEREIGNPWFPTDSPSALIPPPTTAGCPLIPPPDPPPDPPPAFVNHFPSLQQSIASPPLSKKQISRGLGTATVVLAGCKPPFNSVPDLPLAQSPSSTTDCAPRVESDLALTASSSVPFDQFKGFTILPPKKNSHSSPVVNSASNNPFPRPPPNPQPTNSSTTSNQNTTSQPQPPSQNSPPPPQPQPQSQNTTHHSYAQKAKSGTIDPSPPLPSPPPFTLHCPPFIFYC
ncbi:unnamed protein product [Eruca vesicaria subsp. sativa]|uniref:Uncharacterized protein n=1 Tax=Eruca vesicaria subsp. sativa TaxID=29727 RepID=A0ABC8JNP3_ERUVS|nr:unnamed protein product [Eruca vesicaria subsp. sativa]